MSAEKAIEQIRDILQLLYDSYGEDIRPEEQLEIIQGVLQRVKKEKDK